MGCYRCLVVVPWETTLEPVAVCRRCGVMSCGRDGERDLDYPRFICGLCETGRVTPSAGVPPESPEPPPRGGGGVPSGNPDPRPPEGPRGGAAVYVDTADFERRKPGLAAESAAHREVKHREVEQMIEDLMALGTDEGVRALMARHLAGGFDEEELRQTAVLLGNQLEAARDEGRLKPDLFADALGLAAWAIGAEPDGDPTAAQLRYLSDRRLRVALGRSAINERV